MDSGAEQAIYFYTRHPISCAIILSKLRAARGHLNAVMPDELFAQGPLWRPCGERRAGQGRADWHGVTRCGLLRRIGRSCALN